MNLKQKTGFRFKQETGSTLWQMNCYDHVLRVDKEAYCVAGYIWMNPVRKGLCKNFEDYPFPEPFTRTWKNSAIENVWTPPRVKSQMPA